MTEELQIISNFIQEQHIINTYYKNKGYVIRDLSNNIVIPYEK